METNIEREIRKMIAEKIDMAGLTDSQQDKIVSQLLNDILLRISIAVFDSLGNGDREKILKLLKIEDKDAVSTYLNARIEKLPDLTGKIISETIEEFKKLSEV